MYSGKGRTQRTEPKCMENNGQRIYVQGAELAYSRSSPFSGQVDLKTSTQCIAKFYIPRSAVYPLSPVQQKSCVLRPSHFHVSFFLMGVCLCVSTMTCLFSSYISPQKESILNVMFGYQSFPDGGPCIIQRSAPQA